jgi:hypothetical protein
MGRVDGTVGHAPDQRECGADAPRCRGWNNVPSPPLPSLLPSVVMITTVVLLAPMSRFRSLDGAAQTATRRRRRVEDESQSVALANLTHAAVSHSRPSVIPTCVGLPSSDPARSMRFPEGPLDTRERFPIPATRRRLCAITSTYRSRPRSRAAATRRRGLSRQAVVQCGRREGSAARARHARSSRRRAARAALARLSHRKRLRGTALHAAI